MLRTLACAIILSLPLASLAQSTSTDPTPVALETGVVIDVYSAVDEPAKFPGDVNRHLSQVMVYPEAARNAGKQGKVVVRFIVDAAGNAVSPQIMQSAGAASLDAEAERVIRAMPQWKPAKVKGVEVASFFSLPLTFQLR